MKKFWIALLFCMSMSMVCVAAEKVEAPAECKLCGMDRTKFAHSRMVVTYTDGSSTGTCSLNCVVKDMMGAKGKKVASFRVADYNSKKLIDAKTATWVMGGDKRGVMTRVPKWAFAGESDAKLFVKAHGGKVATFDEVVKASQSENDMPPAHHEH